jgi:bifunctional DNA-binding transcriptional regulator/antitoxin component of YhaV-PrlF toxin-antitoxin module
MAVAVRSDSVIERKIISVSTKRQVTIPQKYFEKFGFDREAECILKDDGILIRPIQTNGNEFAEQILADLIAQGYSGNELLLKFRQQSKKIRPAVEKLIAEADEIAKDGSGVSMDDIFGAED